MIVRLLVIGILGILALGTGCAAEENKRPIRMVVSTPPGGNMDGVVRQIVPMMSQRLNTPIIVEYRPGASAMLAAEHVARSTPDGLTVLVVGLAYTLSPMVQTVNFDPGKDLAPVIQLTLEPQALVVRADLGASDLTQFSELLRSQPRGLNCGASPGPARIGCDYLAHLSAGKSVSIPFNGIAPLLTNLLGGQIDFAFLPIGSVEQNVRNGKLRMLAVAGETPLGAPWEKLPSMSHAWPKFDLDGYFGLLVQGRTSPELIARINEAANAALTDPLVRQRLIQDRSIPVGGASDQFARYLGQRNEYFQRVIEKTGLKTQ